MIITHNLLPKLLCYLSLANIVILMHLHVMHRKLVGLRQAIIVELGCIQMLGSHPETAFLDSNHIERHLVDAIGRRSRQRILRKKSRLQTKQQNKEHNNSLHL